MDNDEGIPNKILSEASTRLTQGAGNVEATAPAAMPFSTLRLVCSFLVKSLFLSLITFSSQSQNIESYCFIKIKKWK